MIVNKLERIKSKDIGEIIDETSEQLGIDRKLVNAAVRHSWNEARKAITEITKKEISFKNLGMFTVKMQQGRIEEIIKRKLRQLKYSKNIEEANLNTQKYEWVKDRPQHLRDQLFRLFEMRRQIHNHKAIKYKRKVDTMKLIPYEKAIEFNSSDNLPSSWYLETINKVYTEVMKLKGKHFKYFPEREENYLKILCDSFDQSVLNCVNLRDESPIDEGIVMISSKLFKKDGCIEVNFLLKL